LAAATRSQWDDIGAHPDNGPDARADRFLEQLRRLGANQAGFPVDELTHSLQTAARAEVAGADDEVILGALFHDIGHVFGDQGHGIVAAELLAPHVRTDVVDVVRYHTDFTSRHYAKVFDADPDRRVRFRYEPWFDLAEQFADEWDQASFDPSYPTPPLAHFEPLVRALVLET